MQLQFRHQINMMIEKNTFVHLFQMIRARSATSTATRATWDEEKIHRKKMKSSTTGWKKFRLFSCPIYNSILFSEKNFRYENARSIERFESLV